MARLKKPSRVSKKILFSQNATWVGKPGLSITEKHDLRYDWFVGFADLKNGNKKMAIAVVVAHEEYIGIRQPLMPIWRSRNTIRIF